MKKIALIILLISSQLLIGMERQDSWKLASKMDVALTVIMFSRLLPYIEFIEIARKAIQKPTFTNNSLQNLTANMFMLNTIKKYTPAIISYLSLSAVINQA